MTHGSAVWWRTLTQLTALTATVGILASGVFGTTPRFYDDDPVWYERDTQDASGVKPREISLMYDLVENLFGHPGDDVAGVRAMNVNTVDEVPDSSWFTNRAGRQALTPARVAIGPDVGAGPVLGRWTITSAKSDGITTGFVIRDAAGQQWFIKFDPSRYQGMATGTEVVVTKLMWALGYFVPENHVVHVARADVEEKLGPNATVQPPGARRRPMRLDDIDALLKTVSPEPDGSYRVLASKALSGTPLGGFRYYGTRPDDPNDTIPHEHRRELRALRVFGAWVNHVDAKSINTLDTLLTENGRSFVRHHLIDFGSTLGSGAIGPREFWEGHEYFFEGRPTASRLLSFGFSIPKWRVIPFYEHPAIGRIERRDEDFDPEAWKARVPNPAFLRARADDKFWAARKLMAITDDMIRAAVGAGQFPDREAADALTEALIRRRDAIGRRYLIALNPIVDPVLDAQGVLTFANAAVDAGVAPSPDGYRAVWSTFDNATGEAARIAETTSGGERMPAPSNLSTAPGVFVKVEIHATTGAHPSWQTPVEAYFRRTAAGWRLVGFERMAAPR